MACDVAKGVMNRSQLPRVDVAPSLRSRVCVFMEANCSGVPQDSRR